MGKKSHTSSQRTWKDSFHFKIFKHCPFFIWNRPALESEGVEEAEENIARPVSPPLPPSPLQFWTHTHARKPKILETPRAFAFQKGGLRNEMYVILFLLQRKNSEECVLKGVLSRILVNYSWGIRFGSLCMWLRLISFLLRTDIKGFPGFSFSRKKKAQIYIKDGLFSLPSLPIWRKMKVDVQKLREKNKRKKPSLDVARMERHQKRK